MSPSSVKTHIFAYVRIARPRAGVLMSLVALSAAVLASSGGLSIGKYLLIYLISLLTGSACASYNAYLDLDMDLKLPRKSSRPVAAGIIRPENAVIWGLFLSVAAISLAWTFNLYSSIIVVLGIVGIAAYTALKRKHPLSIILSSVTNGLAVPTLGWVAAEGSINVAGIVLATILILWTFSHLVTISFAHKDEYETIARPTFLRMYGNNVAMASSLIAVSVVYLLSLGLSKITHLGLIYLSLTAILGFLFLATMINLAKNKSEKSGLTAFKFSGMYIVLLSLFIIIDVLVAKF